MSIANQIDRIRAARNKIRTRLVAFGLVISTDDLTDCATAVDGIPLVENVNATVKEGETYQIPRGYHKGNGTVTGTAGGGNYKLQSKSVTPTKSQQQATPDDGFYGLSDVTIEAIPAVYQDVSDVTATAPDVLAGKIIVDSKGKPVAGTMPNNGAVAKTLTPAAPSYTVPKGFHGGTGTIKIITEAKTISPTKKKQTVTPTNGKVLESVTVNAIPENYVDTTSGDALAAEILAGKKAWVDGKEVTGSMANNGATTGTIDGLSITTFAVPAGYTTGGSVSLTNAIENALAAI